MNFWEYKVLDLVDYWNDPVGIEARINAVTNPKAFNRKDPKGSHGDWRINQIISTQDKFYVILERTAAISER
jgi:hypothetical protein